MKAVAVLEPGKVGVVDIPMPEYGEYDCLVHVVACGLCSNTDMMIIKGNHPDSLHPIKYPTILGHEPAGEIVQTGSKVRHLKIGDRVTNPFLGGYLPACGYSLTYGGMAEYAVVPDVKAMKEDGIESPFTKDSFDYRDFGCQLFPSDISFVDATSILSFKENYSAHRNFGLEEGMDLLIYGDGAVGMGLARFAKIYKPKSITVIGHHDDRLEKVKVVAKPDQVINSLNQDPEEVLKDMKFDIVVDAVGRIDIVKQAAGMLKPGGKIGVLGVFKKGQSTLDLYDIPNFTSVQILSFPYQEHRVHEDIIRFMQTEINAQDFISHVMPVEEVQEAVRLVEQREAFKVVLTF